MSLEKQSAARAAVEEVKEGMLVGLGTGSTAAYAISFLGEKVRNGLNITAIPTSEASKQQAEAEGILLTDFEHTIRIDLCIDGADEIDSELNMIKGGGGALLREKIVAASAKRYLIIIDSSKQVETLGAFPLPVEVIPFGWQVVLGKLEGMYARPELRKSGGQPFVTDEGNYIIDCNFKSILEPAQLETDLNRIPGVVENGLFTGMCDRMIMGMGDQIFSKERR
ncbi:MAG: ribose-5-phosphate isomerase RpiA [SAR324 cluster bacterium]|nr:ribose-5-phosphate isomerase RpiA [SAR324 cluster bacterium]